VWKYSCDSSGYAAPGVEVRGTFEPAGQSDGPLQVAGRRPKPDRRRYSGKRHADLYPSTPQTQSHPFHAVWYSTCGPHPTFRKAQTPRCLKRPRKLLLQSFIASLATHPQLFPSGPTEEVTKASSSFSYEMAGNFLFYQWGRIPCARLPLNRSISPKKSDENHQLYHPHHRQNGHDDYH
jgi:hypothetical protein